MSSATTNKPKVLLCGTIEHAKKEWEDLSSIAELAVLDGSLSREQIIEALKTKYKDVVAIYRTLFSAQQTGRFDKEMIAALPPTVKYVCNFGAGYDQIDVDALTERNIQLSNTPKAVDRGTADTTFYLTLGILRNFAWGAYQLRQNNWLKDVELGHDPVSKVLGIVGMGGIGQAFRDRAKAFGFKKIIYYNRTRLSPELEKDTEYCSSLDDLFKQADVISLNLPLNENTRHLINKDTIDKMKDNVYIVNTARGPIIDEDALVEGLESGKIAGVGLDVFENEPKIHPGLLNNHKALLLPHMGTHSVESRYEMEVLVIDNIRSALTTGKVITMVPEQVKDGRFA